MKKFEAFVNEINSPSKNFIFAVNIKNASQEELDKLYKLMNDYFYYLYDSYDEFMENIKNRTPIQAWSIVFNMYKDIKPDKMLTSIVYVHTPGWGEGVKHMEDIISLEKLFEVGFDGVKDYIEMKNNINKYNL